MFGGGTIRTRGSRKDLLLLIYMEDGGTTYITIPRLTLFGLGFPKWQHSIEHLIWKNSR